MRKIRYIPAILVFIFLLPIKGNAQEDAVFKQLVHEYTYHEDGSVDYHHFRELEIGSYYAFHRRYGETFIVYDPEKERLSIRDVHTIMKDGTRVDGPENALNEVLPRNAGHSADYNSLREMVVTHTGLERGARIYLDYVKKTFGQEGEFYSDIKILPEAVPVEKMVFILRFPLESQLYHQSLNIDIAPEMDTLDGMMVYRWEMSDIPAREYRKYSPDAHEYLPCILWSSEETFKKGWKKWAAQEVFHKSVPAELLIFADSMFTEEKSELALALEVMDYVKKTTNVWPLDMEHTRFEPRSALQCWKSSGGTALEVAMLSAQMMKAAGLNAVAAVAVDEDCYTSDLAIRSCWDHPLIRLEYQNDYVWLDPLNKNTFSADASLGGHVLLPILPDAKQEALLVEEPMAAADYSFELKLDDAGRINGTFNAKVSGSSNAWFNEDGMKSAYSISNYTSEALTADWKVERQESKISFSLQAKDSLEQFGEAMKLELPYPSHGADQVLHSRLPMQSNMGVELDYPLSIQVEWNLELPEGYTFMFTHEKLGAGGSVGLFSQLVNQKGNSWQITRQLELPRMINAEGYVDFQEILNLWTDPDLRTFWVKEGE